MNSEKDIRKSRGRRISRREKRESERKKQSKKNTVIKNLIFFIFFILMLYSGRYIIKYHLDTTKTNEIVQKIESDIDKIIDSIDDTNIDEKIDISEFKKMNKDSKFILNIPVLDIKTVVLQTNNNNYYINHDFNKAYSMSGWLFADYRNKLDGTDKNVVVYGHNMRDKKTMFTPLMKFLDTKFFNSLKDEDKIIEIYGENGIKKYKVFSIYQTTDANINLSFPESKEQLKRYINEVKNRSIYNFNENISDKEEILTLLTCGKTNDYRVAVHASRIID